MTLMDSSAISSGKSVSKTQPDWSDLHVSLHSLGAAELNGREGLVIGAMNVQTGRYEVRLDARGPTQPARTCAVKGFNMRAARPTALSARPGAFKASYDWREVAEGQDLPRGLDILASLEGLPTLARIPPRWTMEVAITSRTPLRVEVTAMTRTMCHTRFVRETRCPGSA